jgi:nitroimidazol reductase NimA-like FMN-containing flavoprotein (pyridoxamine 5'-phosphate oxidase superfamily)
LPHTRSTRWRGECHALLDSHHLGRLAFLDRVGVMPMIIPVNYRFNLEQLSSAPTRGAS